jgi:hypothetical protein
VLLAFVNDGRATWHDDIFDARSNSQHAAVRGVLIEMLSALHTAAATGVAPSCGDGVARLNSLRPPFETDGATEALVIICRVTIECFLADDHFEGYRRLGRCRRSTCERWFLEAHGHQAYCSPGCRRTAEREQTPARVQAFRVRRRNA